MVIDPVLLEKLAQRFQIIEQKLATLGDVFDVKTIPYDPQTDWKRVYTDFNDAAREDYFRWLARNKKDELRQIGLDDHDFCRIQTKGTTLSRLHNAYDDYIVGFTVPAFAGGKSNPENLCLMPKKFYGCKSEFERLQITFNPDRPDIRIITRKTLPDGTYSILPVPLQHNMKAA